MSTKTGQTYIDLQNIPSSIDPGCTCRKDTEYSFHCCNAQHRRIARDIVNFFPTAASSSTGSKRRPRGTGKGPYRRRDWKARATFWLANMFNTGKIEKGIVIFILGFLLLTLGSQIYHRAVDPQSLQQIIENQTVKPKIVWVDRPRDPKLVPALEDAVNLHFSEKVGK